VGLTSYSGPGQRDPSLRGRFFRQAGPDARVFRDAYVFQQDIADLDASGEADEEFEFEGPGHVASVLGKRVRDVDEDRESEDGLDDVTIDRDIDIEEHDHDAK
jgi:hypothetical protein